MHFKLKLFKFGLVKFTIKMFHRNKASSDYQIIMLNRVEDIGLSHKLLDDKSYTEEPIVLYYIHFLSQVHSQVLQMA